MKDISDEALAASFKLVGFATAAAVALPVAAVVAGGYGVGKLVGWLNRPRPTPTSELERAARSVVPLPAKFDEFFRPIVQRQDTYPHWKVFLPLTTALTKTYDLFKPVIPTLAPNADEIRIARYRDQLRAFAEVSNVEGYEALYESILQRVTNSLPPFVLRSQEEFQHDLQTDEPDGAMAISLIDALPEPGETVAALIYPFFSEALERSGAFASLKRQFNSNLCRVSRLPDEPESLLSPRMIFPTDFEGTAAECFHAYLHDTPFEYLFAGAAIPIEFMSEAWREHGYILGNTGSGKTQLLQNLILGFIREPDPPALVIVDSQGDMLRKIEQLSELKDRLIIIDPEDDESPALNMFDMETPRLQGYSRNVREQVEASVIELYNYLFGALESQLTSKQSTAFTFSARLMLSIPGATIHTFRRLMETKDASEFTPFIERLDTTAREFFERQFFTKAFGDTREQVARRLYDFLRVPAFDRIFSAPRNTLDMFEAMQSGKVVLVNTSKALLKGASGLFGRYLIMQVLAATYERVAVPEHARRPAFLIVDEAHEYFDKSIEDMLTQARKYRVGLIAAHQSLDQAGDIRSALIANTAVKMVGGVSDKDARALAPDMRTTPDFLTDARKSHEEATFTCFIRNDMPKAVHLTIPFGALEDAPQMSYDDHRQLRIENRARYAYRALPPPSAAPAVPVDPPRSSAKSIEDLNW